MIKQVCCKWCGKQFYATSRGEYCSGKCKVAAHRAKKKEVKRVELEEFKNLSR